MKRSLQCSLAAFVLFAAFFTLGCPNREKIARINDDPARFSDKEVAIAGRVVDSYGFLGLGAYEVDDGTGRIWVISRRRGAPSRGAQVGAKGRVYTGFNYGGRSFGTVIEESDRRIK